MQAQSQGSFLKAAREAKGLTLDMAHEATKIPLDALRAIEDGYSVRSISPFYLKGFLKMYAEYLGVPPQEVIEGSPKEGLSRTSRPPVEEFDLGQWTAKIFTKERLRQMVTAAGILLCFFLIFKTITFFTHRKPKVPAAVPKVSKSVKTQKPETGVKAAAKESKKAPAKAQKVPPASKTEKTDQSEKEEKDIVALEKIRLEEIVGGKKGAKSVSSEVPPVPEIPPKTVYTAAQPMAVSKEQPSSRITLTARAKKDSWLRVKADESVVFQSTLNKGAAETWTAGERIEISGKNIGQLEFELNGKWVGSLGRKDLGAKKVVATRDGLSVTQ